ncbi:hypothetical protein DF146_02185 [Burkholderia cenocepacia]|nr:hypothetical protein DF165_05935 [Burkholderia cenocepacia]RQU59817.1 hypothetical protein DF146_02185 [Burkholderia cenocepacia]SOT40743.1 conserved hypothetical protein [Burkholderia cenocepacia]
MGSGLGAISRQGRSACRFGARFSDRAWRMSLAAFPFEDASVREFAPYLAAERLSRIADAAGLTGCAGRVRNPMKMNSARFIPHARGQNDKKG